MASPMLQELFGGRLVGRDVSFERLDATDAARVASVAAGFTGLLSLFNILGRFFWSPLSDRIGHRTLYTIFFLVGLILYTVVPGIGRAGNVAVFVPASASYSQCTAAVSRRSRPIWLMSSARTALVLSTADC